MISPSLALFDLQTSSAVISDCGLYRYRLGRRWGQGTTMLFVMLNPSTADGTEDDPTIRRCIGFAKREGHAALDVVNLFAFRATDPRELTHAVDPVGPGNDAAIADAVQGAAVVVAAWGATVPRARSARPAEVLRLLSACPVMALGLTATGAPRHPLYLPAAAPLQFYTGA